MGKNARPTRKRDISSLHPFGHLRQSSILDHLQPMGKSKKRQTDNIPEATTSGARHPEGQSEVQRPHIEEMSEKSHTLELSVPSYCLPPVQKREEEAEVGPDWDQKANSLLRKHFGYSGLKSFQKETLGAWFAHQDCLVLAATGSGKSLCFQIPALLTGKVVVVISPLISLMHDQCLKLAKHGISACFLGSGQPDNSVEKKAMNGIYSIIYVCPETLLRLISPLQRLAENVGIALFAIDEVHCVSKWGHDFRPDYRRMSVLRESFSSSSLDFLKFDIPIMALTATATDHVREDILKSLKLSKDAKIVLTTFFRPNLKFSIMHSRTSSPSSYVKDFQDLVKVYSNKKTTKESSGRTGSVTEDLEDSLEDSDSMSDTSNVDEQDDELSSHRKMGFSTSKERQLSVEFLEDDFDDIQTADDFDVSCGEFCGTPLVDGVQLSESTELPHPTPQPAESSQYVSCSLEQGPTIIYVPTRKQTVAIAKYLRAKGVKAEPYHAALPKSHLRRVHKEFHEDALEVVVATIAFGMGIDKLNVRRIIHYGWPQSLEAYYQEAGRAGRDGKLADCTLYANLSKIPTLLPNKRSEEQKKNAYKMLADCYRYGMNTSICRAKVLVEYFGEVFHQERCMTCDVCRNGPPELQNMKAEANIFMQVIAAHYKQQGAEYSYDDLIGGDMGTSRSSERLTLRLIVTKIREHSQQFLASDQLWWRGLARLMQDKGFIREGGNMIGVQIKCPEPTNQGLKYLESGMEQDFYAYPEADMLLSATREQQPFSSFSEWGKGWADPEIRKQRLARRRAFKKPRKSRNRKSRKQSNSMTVKERISARLSKWKR
ncbi:ATP-dependent DNA helicase Q-like SIM isoform X2 [Chenopodium quinoa]|nr:ATP-dependent DNA helicase Q-like SIM isoform X2 [Chenopodium quinoa]